MIPHQLQLKNFFSYREATLDFTGLHTACICGANGAGKSSLLEAIAWSIWGKSRAASEDDAIHIGEKEVRVDFTFQSQGQICRVIRSRRRGQSSSLEFQVETPTGFRSLTAKGLRATQQKLLDHLKLDYDTFINSAYLRQGRADEFMLRSPSERKQILADLLKLDLYDELSKKANSMANQTTGQEKLLLQNLETLKEQLQQESEIATELARTQTHLDELQQVQEGDRATLTQLQAQQNQRQGWQQQLDWYRQQGENRQRESQRQQQELTDARQRQQELSQLLEQETEIDCGYAQFQQLQGQEEVFSQKFNALQDARTHLEGVREQLTQQANDYQQQQQGTIAELEALDRQAGDLARILAQSAQVEAGLKELQTARDRLQTLDRLQAEVAPLMQRRLQLQGELDRATARLNARLEQIQAQQIALGNPDTQTAQLQSALAELGEQISELEKKQVHQQRVREKGLERRSFLDRLKAHQRDYEANIEEFDRKIKMLQVPDAQCPLCDRPLDEHHWDLVAQKHQEQHRDIMGQLWVVKEQLAVSELEIQVLRQEYGQLSHELAGYDALRERRGQLQAQLDASDRDRSTLEGLAAEQIEIERSLEVGDYAVEVRSELEELNRTVDRLDYDEKNHALARGAVDRLRWAQIKDAELRSAKTQQAKIDERRPELVAHSRYLEQQLDRLHAESELARQRADLERYIANLDYNLTEHSQVRGALREAQVWVRKAEELRGAKQESPRVQQRIGGLMESVQQYDRDAETARSQMAAMRTQLERTPDRIVDIQTLEGKIQQRRRELDGAIAEYGRLQQQQQQLETLQTEYEQRQRQLQAIRRQSRVYRELSQAFGKNGIQALTIENVLPELEGETNRILSRLSANQLHVRFVTQRASKGSKKKTKLIDTLDILIADARGTRPYETYSGGEAFRINFAIRLALAKLLAGRSGTALQLLIIDEGFGTQDDRGCERLVAAINAISSDFACILAVTHIPHLKEAFQARIEVQKMENGSQLHLSI
ncbi:exonuclease subunit SbcC [Oscillatoriales cyanobacterium LEGE 11467]|uniref:Nuclease SbcCD subunit C n=1 Tax=Zarconia navalis LEGE 11467 TaxID=1828826 RepID=A0A928W0U0_9CYAN|nr:exonuclease subunit SbcC [Zarconia navalis]MBE9042422.1 exonuclease subunit SbcC [Zarconia navalis LEGE 11467]